MSSSVEATQVLKRELRKRMRAALAVLPASQMQSESQSLAAQLHAHPLYQSARSIALYISMPTEVNTAPLITHALSNQKRVFLPRVISKATREMLMLEVHSPTDLQTFPRGAYNIPEPPVDGRASAPLDVRLDLVVVPGVAFDMHGRRCGHGMGFYDVFFAQCARDFPPMPKLIALALSPQLVDVVPTTGNDWLVDHILVTEPEARG